MALVGASLQSGFGEGRAASPQSQLEPIAYYGHAHVRPEPPMEAKSLFAIEALARVAAVLAAALAAWAAWYAGIGWFNGSEGIEWLNGFQWGALPACAAIAVACAAAMARDYNLPRLLAFIAAATALSFAAFAGARDEIYAFHSYVFMPPAPAHSVWLALYWLCVSAGLAWLANRLLAPVRWRAALYLAAGLILAVYFAYLTVSIFPAGRHEDMYNAIRLGYPAFWTAILLPAALRLGRKPAA